MPSSRLSWPPVRFSLWHRWVERLPATNWRTLDSFLRVLSLWPLLLSAFPHPLSLAGLTEAFNDIADARRHRNPHLEVLGIVFAGVDRRATKLRSRLEAVVHEALPGRRFRTQIPQAIVLPEVSGRGITLFQDEHLKNHPVTMEYRRLAAEVEHRVTHRAEFLALTLAEPDLSEAGAAPRRNAETGPIAANQ